MSADNLISIYSSAREVVPSGQITISDFVEKIRNGFFAEWVYRVRHAPTEEAKGKAKLQFPAVQISGHVTSGKRAQAIQEGRFEHSGFLQLDIDDDGLVGKTPTEARALLATDPHVLAAFITPSGKGAKALLRIEPCATDKEHKAAFAAAEKYIFDTYGLKIDPATKDPGRLCFFSADADCTRNDNPQVFPVPELPAEVSRPTANRVTPTGKPRHTSKKFPEPPKEGIHGWLMVAAWHCRLADRLTEAETIEKLESYDGTLRRPYQSNEVRNAVTKVFASPLRRSIFDDPDQEPGELDLTRFSSTDAGNADRVHAYAGLNFRYVVESGRWLIWDGQRWNPDNDGGMVRLFVLVMRETGKQAFDKLDPDAAKPIAKHALQSLDAHRVAAGLKMLKSVLGVSVSVNDLDADPWLMGTPEGMIDLKSGQPITPDRDKLITKSIGASYDATATCPTWEKFLHTVTDGDAELSQFLQAAIGYTLTGSNREQCLFFLHGTGSNGKGVFSETIKRLIGDYGQTAPESLFTKDRNQSATNDIARLAGCRMAIAAELEEGTHFAESRVKALTGDDTITARFLHKEFFDFQPTHHFWISGNHRPRVTGTDAGIWRRIRLVPFTVTIPEAEKDKDLPNKLAAELPGILNWALEGCLRWQREGLETPACVKQATEEYRAEEDVLGQFLAECTEESTGDRVTMSNLFEAYQAWAIEGGIRQPLSARSLNKKLDERGMHRTSSNGQRYWDGIRRRRANAAKALVIGIPPDPVPLAPPVVTQPQPTACPTPPPPPGQT
jgi:P4 family phage/plasmid primase-like protien